MVSRSWFRIPCLSSQLQLKTTLTGGQSFRWKAHGNAADEFVGVFANIVWILKQSQSELLYRIVGELPYPAEEGKLSGENPTAIRIKISKPERSPIGGDLLYSLIYYEQLLRIYFRLDVDLEECYQQWTKCHVHFESSADQFYAVRQLDQDPVENLVSFICSQNNNISRISGLVEKICSNYGEKICDYDGTTYYNFPDVARLAPPEVETHLRDLSFGYRAKYIQKSAEEIVSKGGLEWFRTLQRLDYKEAHKELLSLTGIGPKVADCICLMSLNHLQAIPVDTHVFQIAKHYLPQLGGKQTKSITGRLYGEIGDKFREIYGERAGWAQTVLFCADLRQFKQEEAGGAKEGGTKRVVELTKVKPDKKRKR